MGMPTGLGLPWGYPMLNQIGLGGRVQRHGRESRRLSAAKNDDVSRRKKMLKLTPAIYFEIPF